MAKAIITLEDTGEGLFQANIEYVDGFSDQSVSHQYGHLLMCQLNKWATPEGPEAVVGNAPATREPVAEPAQ